MESLCFENVLMPINSTLWANVFQYPLDCYGIYFFRFLKTPFIFCILGWHRNPENLHCSCSDETTLIIKCWIYGINNFPGSQDTQSLSLCNWRTRDVTEAGFSSTVPTLPFTTVSSNLPSGPMHATENALTNLWKLIQISKRVFLCSNWRWWGPPIKNFIFSNTVMRKPVSET